MIKLRNIKKIYRMGMVEVTALSDINLDVEAHEFVCVMGASGSGKSTLMNIIGCLDRPTEGTYLLDGSDVSTLNDAELAAIRNKKVGFVFQTFNLLPRISALRNVELPLVYSKVKENQRKMLAMEALKKVDLGDRAKHKPNELSGGQRQRVAIARALVNNPSIIFADEPTGNLDSRTGLSIIAIFQKLHSMGATIIMVTHEMDIALHADRIIYLKDGKITGDEKIIKPKNAELELLSVADMDKDELADAISKHEK
ncbi:MAG: macrolide ABC transporter ATP-binding protein [Spirochaetes bacterium]|nr:MAG: macrolide ABC transporter ATP-binding protein [Spirochaetota bacterium]